MDQVTSLEVDICEPQGKLCLQYEACWRSDSFSATARLGSLAGVVETLQSPDASRNNLVASVGRDINGAGQLAASICGDIEHSSMKLADPEHICPALHRYRM